jgi:hypothetical protein
VVASGLPPGRGERGLVLRTRAGVHSSDAVGGARAQLALDLVGASSRPCQRAYTGLCCRSTYGETVLVMEVSGERGVPLDETAR